MLDLLVLALLWPVVTGYLRLGVRATRGPDRTRLLVSFTLGFLLIFGGAGILVGSARWLDGHGSGVFLISAATVVSAVAALRMTRAWRYRGTNDP
jgi:ascorbate-specific PTS system EIIC-type component UlaA